MKNFYFVFLSALMSLFLSGCGQDSANQATDSAITAEAWGPKSMEVGQIPNKQANGAIGVWFTLSEAVEPNDIEAWVGEQKMGRVRVTGQKGAFAVPSHLTDKPGKLPMHLVHVPSGKQIPLGDFEVVPSAEGAPEISITAWGPKSTSAGEAFNVQQNGASSIWFKMSGAVAPGTMEAWFGETKLEKLSVASHKGGAMQIPQKSLAQKGEFPIYLVHKPSKKRYPLGTFVVK